MWVMMPSVSFQVTSFTRSKASFPEIPVDRIDQRYYLAGCGGSAISAQ